LQTPQFPPRVDFGGPNYRLQASHIASHVDWPSRTLLTVRLARQDAVLLHRRTTTALVTPHIHLVNIFHLSLRRLQSVCVPYTSTFMASHIASHVDWPSRTLLTVRPARQDAVLLRRSLAGQLQHW